MAPLVWLITGTSQGLGAELAHAALRRGDKVIATARAPVSRLTDLEKAGASTMELDVSWNEAQIKAAVSKALEVYGHIDVIVPNAGYAEFMVLEDMTQESWSKQLAVNWFGVTTLVAAILPHFRSRRTGTVALMNSVYSHISGAFGGPYAATKHAMSGYSKTLNDEVGQFNVRSISFDIGYIRTGFVGAANLSKPHGEDYTQMYEEFGAILKAVAGNQPGDPVKAMERLVDVVKGEGLASGKSTSTVVPLGPDATGYLRKNAEAVLQACKEWEELAASVAV